MPKKQQPNYGLSVRAGPQVSARVPRGYAPRSGSVRRRGNLGGVQALQSQMSISYEKK